MAVETVVQTSFKRMRFMATLGARLAVVEHGRVVIEVPFDASLTQQHGFIHAGVLASIADSVGGYAALTTMPVGSAVLAVEFKINLLRPATGVSFRADAKVIKPGRTLTVTEIDVIAEDADGKANLCARMQQTCMAVDLYGRRGPPRHCRGGMTFWRAPRLASGYRSAPWTGTSAAGGMDSRTAIPGRKVVCPAPAGTRTSTVSSP